MRREEDLAWIQGRRERRFAQDDHLFDVYVTLVQD